MNETAAYSESIEYIKQNGSTLEKWAAMKLLKNETRLPENWSVDQNDDGGWKNRSTISGYSHMGTTAITLLQLILWGLKESPETKKTIEFLWSIQQAEGRWTENPALKKEDMAEYNTPGDVKVDLWVTANNLASLCVLGYKDDPRVLKAINWVEQLDNGDGTFPGYIHTTYAMAAIMWFINEFEKAEKYLQASLNYLHKYKNEEWYDTMELTWSLMLWSNAGIRKDHPVVKVFLDELLAKRDDDGIWPSIYLGSSVSFTTEALWIIKKLG